MTTRLHHPACPARDGTRNNLDRCICRDGIPVVDLTETVTACYQHAEALRGILHRSGPILNGGVARSLTRAVDFLEHLAAVLDGSSTIGDEPRPWNGEQPREAPR